jgi:hypothetical protein
MTEPLDLDALKARLEQGYPAHWSAGAAASARHEDMLALIVEVERLRADLLMADKVMRKLNLAELDGMLVTGYEKRLLTHAGYPRSVKRRTL